MQTNKNLNSLYCIFLTIIIIGSLIIPLNGSIEEYESMLTFSLSFPENVHQESITGRVYVIISQSDKREPRFQVGTRGVPFFGKDVHQLDPRVCAVINRNQRGYPILNLGDIPSGHYFVQGFINIYTKFERSDGFTLWMHNDQWEGQRWQRSPGNLYSVVKKVYLDPKKKQNVHLICDRIIPPIKIPPDTKWVKRIKFKSEILSKFWGKPIYLGATILLPKAYKKHKKVYYPVNYIQGHFSLRNPYGFRTEDPGKKSRWARMGYEFYKFWSSKNCPRLIAVTFQDPCPYYDTSYGVNSPNTGPYGDAILKELIPYVEERFRIIRQPYARILSGGSTGGWESLALQILHPDFFGGTFSLCPDPVDFRYFQCVDIYKDQNAYYKIFNWIKVPTPSDRSTDGVVRLTYQQRNHYELVSGTKNRSGGQIDIFEAIYGPIGPDGYVKPLFDKITGEIDPEVAQYWKEHYDLRVYLERNWEKLGPKLKGKLFIYTGDMDTFYLNNAVKLMEEFLKSTKNPHYEGLVKYGDGEPHCWGPRGAELINLIADLVTKNAPKDADPKSWKYR
jgi:hypothetical protein